MRKLLKLLTSRLFVVALAMLLQLGMLFLLLVRFSEFFPWYNTVVGLCAMILTVVIVSKPDDPAYQIAWIIPILLMPLFGVSLYLLFGGNRLPRRLHRNVRRMEETMSENLTQDEQILDLLELENPIAAAQAHYLVRNASCPIYVNTATEYFPSGESCYARMLEDLRTARETIYLEYFIIERGKMWDGILEILREKAENGVDVRVVYDDFGGITKLPAGYHRELEALGIRTRRFNPFVPIVSPWLGNRDHRKILVIDGKIAFTGGINLADEYINVKPLYGHWKDCGIRLEGDAAWSMNIMFLSMWNLIHAEPSRRFEPPVNPLRQDRGYVQPFTDSPLDSEGVAKTVFLNMISRAQKSVYIMTPYLILDSTMRSVLCVAAKSSIDVRIITPGTPDKRYVYAVTRANYRELLEAGVRIYEYQPGFIHSKVICVDMTCAVVGTVNMDFRSLYLHCEDGVFLYDTASVQEVSNDFADTLPRCREVTPQLYQERSAAVRLVEMALRVFAPLM